MATSVSASPLLTVLHTFDITDGQHPTSALVQGGDGSFYGTTSLGGSTGLGTIFKIAPDNTFSLLHTFMNADGAGPMGGVTFGSDGNLYGTTTGGGPTPPFGTVYSITMGGSLTTLYAFSPATISTHGGASETPLFLAGDGTFYGTTGDISGGSPGTVFSITPAGNLQTLAVLTTAASPSGLVQASDGNFYGSTFYGGANSYGTIFQVTPAGQFASLHSFDYNDGAQPLGTLVQGPDGQLYGTVSGPGAGGVFKITTTGVLTTLHTFSYSDGQSPYAGLLMGSDGNFYGTTYKGGANKDGTVFEMSADGTLTTLWSFSGTDGFAPTAALVQGDDGSFYGTTELGGASGAGTVFKLSTGLPAAPSGLLAVPGNKEVVLQWKAISGTGVTYEVFEGTSPKGEAMVPVKSGIRGVKTTITGLHDNVPYFFKVAALNAVGVGPRSNEVQAIPHARSGAARLP